MIRIAGVFAVATLSVVALACGPGEPEPAGGPAVQAGPIPEGAEMPPNHPPVSTLPTDHPDVPVGGESGTSAAAAAADARTGTVLEAMSAAGYTYVRMDFDGEELWVAGPQSPLEEGDEVTISGLMGMTNFYARSLDRTFETILFANTFSR